MKLVNTTKVDIGDPIETDLDTSVEINASLMGPKQMDTGDHEMDDSGIPFPGQTIIVPDENFHVSNLGGQRDAEKINNLLRHPDDSEIREGIKQEKYDEVSSESTRTVLDQDIYLAVLELDKIIFYSFEEGTLNFLVRFKSGKTCSISYAIFREDFPLETSNYIISTVDENGRYGK